ncbi:F-box domain-containing protein [Pleurotus pulmonarius]
MMSTIASSGLLGLPTEILLAIIYQLDLSEIVALSETSVAANSLTRDRTIWLHLFHSIKTFQQPFPHHVNINEDDLSAEDLELIVHSSQNTANLWASPRLPRPLIYSHLGASTVVSLEFFLDRWLLSIHLEGHPQLKSIISVMSVQDGLHFRIYRIPLPKLLHEQPGPAELLRSFEGRRQFLLKTIDVDRRLTVFVRSNRVKIVYWGDFDGSRPPSQAEEAPRIARLSIAYDDTHTEDLLDGLVTIRIFGPYLLAFRVRSLGIFALPLRQGDADHLLYKHMFSLNAFKNICTSTVEIVNEMDEPFPLRMQFTFQAYDVLQGLFVYEVCIRATSDYSITPMVDLTLIGVYPLAHIVNAMTPPSIAHLAPYPTSSLNTSPSRGAPTPTPTQISFGYSVSQSGVAARGFISSFTLGPQGRRAIWIERSRVSTTRDLIVWSKAIDPSDQPRTIEIMRRVIHTIGSYDLRDDVTCSALAEASGRIAFANRAGNIFLIPAIRQWDRMDDLIARLLAGSA